MIAARQLVEEWARKVGQIALAQFETPRECYMAFSEWLYGKITPVMAHGEGDRYTNAFEMEVFRRMLPRYDVFQMILAYLPRQQKVTP